MQSEKTGRIGCCFVRILWIYFVLTLVVATTGCQKPGPQAQNAGKYADTSGQTNSGVKSSGRFDYRQITLDNGLKVITLEDFSCPIVAVQLWYHVGSKDERPDRQGFAHMFEHMMFRGTDRLGPTDFFGYIRRVGGQANGYTSFDRTVYLETLPADQLQLALWLEADRMAFLKIDQEAFVTERKVVEEERRMHLNEPYGTLMENLLAEVYKVHPYRWAPIGKIRDLEAASVQEIRNFWLRYYIPSNASLIIAGAVTHAQAHEAARRYLGWLPRYAEPPRVAVREPMPGAARSVTIKEKNAPAPGVGVLYRTVPVRDRDSIVLDIAAEIIGGGHSSRLYRELVAEKQLAVQVFVESYSLEQDGLFGVGAAMPPFGSDPNRVLDIISENVGRLRTEPVTQRELLKARNQKLRDLVTDNLTISSKAGLLGSAAVDVNDVSYVNRIIDDIERVTEKDILRVANEYLSPQRVLKVKVERNLLSSIKSVLGGDADEPDTPVAPGPGQVSSELQRGDIVPGKSFPKDPPFAKISTAKLTPNYETTTLSNGLKVYVVPNHEVPFVTVQLGLLAGAWTETMPGAASMAMQMLTKGTRGYTEGQLADELETYAISIAGQGGVDTSTVGMSCLAEHVERAMGFMDEIVLHPIFPADEFEKLRRQVLTSLAVRAAEPEYLAEREFRRRLYGNHFYSRTATGEVEDVNALNVEGLKKWYQAFARPDTAVLIFAGDIDNARAFALAARTFGAWKTPQPKPQVEMPELPKDSPTHIYLVDRPGSIQSQIRVGQRGITRRDAGYFVSRVVSNYFGWAFNSRLNQRIRVEKGLTYDVWGGYTAKRFAGDFAVGTFTKVESTAETVREVVNEIKRLKSEAPTDEELQFSRSYILGSFIMQRETPQQIAGDLWLIESEALGRDYLERLLAGVADADKADCIRLTERMIDADKLVIVVVGEAAKLGEALEKIAPVTVVGAEDEK
jgi:zinc protease